MPDISKKSAFKFVILLGVISLLADMTYEGARSITGPYLAVLGASATAVGIVAGFGELLGYGLRLLSGYLIDRTHQYWTITLFGYAINLLAVPLLALAGSWEMAAVLMMLERIGKAIRTPARDVMLAHAGHQLGKGIAFGIHESLDKLGAMLGPLIVALVLYFKGDYRDGFALLLIPALLALTILYIAFRLYPNPHELEPAAKPLKLFHSSKFFKIYLVSSTLIAAGYADFPLIAFHFQKAAVLSPIMIPVTYALAMGTSALAALVCGHLYERYGMHILIITVFASALFAPLVFLGGAPMVLLGAVLWGLGMGVQGSLMRAVIAERIPQEKRGMAYGVFNATFGIAWFLGSALMGVLYDTSLISLILFSVGAQLIAGTLLILTKS